MKLGKLAPRFDERTLRFAKYANNLKPAPKEVDWGSKVSNWGMLGNDKYGDCTFAGAAHMSQCWEACEGRSFIPDAGNLVTEYLKFTGGKDTGCAMLDVLKKWQKDGILGHKIGAFAEVHGREHLRQAVYLFGGAYLGLSLPLSAQGRRVWEVGKGSKGAPGSWGGHCVDIVAYDATGPICITWGAYMRMTWGFYDKYADESYAILSKDFLSPMEMAPNGFNRTALTADLAQL